MTTEQSLTAEAICRDVAELPDRNSPDYWPEAMLVTHDELKEIVLRHLAAIPAQSEPGMVNVPEQPTRLMQQAGVERREAADALERMQKETRRWQPIETAPKGGACILVGNKHGSWIAKYLPVYQSGFVPENPWSSMMLNHDHIGEKWHPPTHWQPLPEPPAALDHEQPARTDIGTGDA